MPAYEPPKKPAGQDFEQPRAPLPCQSADAVDRFAERAGSRAVPFGAKRREQAEQPHATLLGRHRAGVAVAARDVGDEAATFLLA